MTVRPGQIPAKVFYSVIYYFKGLYRRFNEENIVFFASGIAFNAILCLIPVLLLLTSLLGIVLHTSHFPLGKIDEILNTVFPPQPYAQSIKNSIRDVIADVIRYRSTLGIYGVATFIWTATSLFSALRIVVNKIYRLPTSKVYIVRIAEDIVLVIILTILFFISNMFVWFLQLLQSLAQDIPALDQFNLTAIAKSIPTVVSYMSALIMFFIVNRFIPDNGVNSRVAFVASLTTTTLWWIAGKGFGIYLSTVHSYSKLYGTYAFLLVFLVWIYYSSIVFIIGVIVGELYRERRFPNS